MKVMISMPMNGRSDEEVVNEFNRITEEFNKLHIDVVDSYFVDEAKDYIHPEIYYMAKSIDMMGKVDAVYFAKDWHSARGCRIERQVALEYGLKILEHDFLDIMTELTTVKTIDEEVSE